MAKLNKREKETIHRQVLEMVGGHDRGPTWVGVRPSIIEDKRPTMNKKRRRTENKQLCREYAYC